MSSLFLIRHAQASFGTDDYDRLSPLGHRQAAAAGRYLSASVPAVDAIYAGTARRHRETAEGIAGAVRTKQGTAPAIVIDARLDEVDAEGQFKHLLPQLQREDAELAQLAREVKTVSRSYQKVLSRVFKHWQELGEHPQLESWAAFSTRVAAAVKDVARVAGSGANTVVVSSGGVIAAIAQHTLGLPKSAAYPLFEALLNCSITRLLHTAERISLVSFNDYSYLQTATQRPELQQNVENLATYR
jgi:broad specificity phosphatase PhoE